MQALTQEQIDAQIQEMIPVLKRRAGSFCKMKEDADELFQETFLKIWLNRHKFTYNESLKAWCYKIMYNTFVDGFKESKKKLYFDGEEDESYCISSDMLGELKDYNDAESVITVKDIYETIDEVLGTTDRFIVRRILEGYKQQEIAQELKLERNNVKQHYFQAIRKVRTALADKFGLDPGFGQNDELIETHKVYRRRKQSKEASHRKKFEL